MVVMLVNADIVSVQFTVQADACTCVCCWLQVYIWCRLFLYAFRLKLSTNVNCWFCNENSSVPYGSRNSWDCCFCGQYNGFKAVCIPLLSYKLFRQV